MNGQILPGTCIAVDFWKIRGKQENYIHFLTHVHGDHIVGLTPSWTRPIYCSDFTAQILRDHYGISSDLLQVLPLNQSTFIAVPYTGDSFCVTAFDANHCPGAVMFYFEGNFGNILHTGDFRYSNEMTGNLENLCGKIDKLYLDNTFCSLPCVFPTRKKCLQEIIEIIKRHPSHDILIGVRKLGKESMLAQIGVALDETIYVSHERFSVTQRLFDCNVFSALGNGQSGRIRAIPFHSITTKQRLVYEMKGKPTIAILPTAIYTGLPFQVYAKHPYIHVVPYSDHSSFPELVQFIRKLQPKTIIPIVLGSRGPFGTDISDRSDMSQLISYSTIGNEAVFNLYCKLHNVSSYLVNPNSTDIPNVDDNEVVFSPTANHDNFSSTNGGSKRPCDFQTDENANEPGRPSIHVMKRKQSLPVKKKRKIAQGVVYNDDACPDESHPLTDTCDSVPSTTTEPVLPVETDLLESDQPLVHKSSPEISDGGMDIQSKSIECAFQSEKSDLDSDEVLRSEVETLSKLCEKEMSEGNENSKLGGLNSPEPDSLSSTECFVAIDLELKEPSNSSGKGTKDSSCKNSEENSEQMELSDCADDRNVQSEANVDAGKDRGAEAESLLTYQPKETADSSESESQLGSEISCRQNSESTPGVEAPTLTLSPVNQGTDSPAGRYDAGRCSACLHKEKNGGSKLFDWKHLEKLRNFTSQHKIKFQNALRKLM